MQQRSFFFARFPVVLLFIAFPVPGPIFAQTLNPFKPGKLPISMDLHGSAVAGERLYVFGGKARRRMEQTSVVGTDQVGRK